MYSRSGEILICATQTQITISSRFRILGKTGEENESIGRTFNNTSSLASFTPPTGRTVLTSTLPIACPVALTTPPSPALSSVKNFLQVLVLILSIISKLPTSTESFEASWEREEGRRREVYMLIPGSAEGEGEKVSKEEERRRRLIEMAKVRERVSFLRALPTTAGAGRRAEEEEGPSPPPPGKVCQLEVVETASEFATEAASSNSSLMAANKSFGGNSLAPGGRPSCRLPNMRVEAFFSAALASGV